MAAWLRESYAMGEENIPNAKRRLDSSACAGGTAPVLSRRGPVAVGAAGPGGGTRTASLGELGESWPVAILPKSARRSFAVYGCVGYVPFLYCFY